jgi:hypothetical protein
VWITLFFKGLFKKIFRKPMPCNALFTGFFTGNEKQSVLLYTNNGVDYKGFMFQFSLLIKKNEA